MITEYAFEIGAAVLATLALLVVYYVLLVRTILAILRREESTVLQFYAFASLVPLPPFIVLGIMVMIIWHHHSKPRQPGFGSS